MVRELFARGDKKGVVLFGRPTGRGKAKQQSWEKKNVIERFWAVLGKPRTTAFLDNTRPLGVLAMCHCAIQ